MSKTYRPYDPDQQLLLPAALQEWLPSDHLSYFISDIVDQLDLSAITGRYDEQRGGPPYHPRMIVKPESTERRWPCRIERGWEARASESEASIPVDMVSREVWQ